MSNCFKKYDLNPKTCKFVSKCPEGKIRDENFKCVNKPEIETENGNDKNKKED